MWNASNVSSVSTCITGQWPGHQSPTSPPHHWSLLPPGPGSLCQAPPHAEPHRAALQSPLARAGLPTGAVRGNLQVGGCTVACRDRNTGDNPHTPGEPCMLCCTSENIFRSPTKNIWLDNQKIFSSNSAISLLYLYSCMQRSRLQGTVDLLWIQGGVASFIFSNEMKTACCVLSMEAAVSRLVCCAVSTPGADQTEC